MSMVLPSELQVAQRRGNRPFVTASFATCRDGVLTAERGRPTAISSEDSMRLTHQLRAMHDGILVGIGTVLSDDPQLSTRLVTGPSPRRIVLDSSLRTPVTARVLQNAQLPTILVASLDAPETRAAALREAGAHVVRVERSVRGIDLQSALEVLADCGLHRVMVEGGAEVLDSFFSAQLVDFVMHTVAQTTLSSPVALKLGAATSAALQQWSARNVQLGSDVVSLGPWSGTPSK